jgi:hypothetical protein
MKIKIYLIALLIILLSLAQVLFSQVGIKKVAQSTMNFLLVSTSPKASAMGEAYYSVGIGSEAMFYNPAAIAEIGKEFDVTMNITNWIADIRYIGGGVAWNLGNYGAVGANIISVDYGTIYGTSLINPGEQNLYPLGYIDNGVLSNISAMAVGLSYAKAINSQFLIGGNIKIATQNLGENITNGNEIKKNNAAKLVFDAGVKYYTGYRSFRFGMAIRNFSSNIKREEIEEQLPLTFTMGVAIDLLNAITGDPIKDNSFTLAVDFLHQNSYSERVNIGAEYQFMGMISLRAGYQTNRDLASWSLGIGVSQNIFDKFIRIDYSYSKFDLFNGVNRFGIGVQF